MADSVDLKTLYAQINQKISPSRYTEALAQIKSVKRKLCGETKCRLELQVLEVRLLRLEGKLVRAFEMLQIIEEAITECKDDKLTLSFLSENAYLLWWFSAFHKLNDVLDECDQVYERLDEPSRDEMSRTWATVLHVKGITLGWQGKLDESIELLEESLELRKLKGDETAIALAYLNLAHRLESKGSYDQAMDYVNKAAKIYKDYNNPVGIVRSTYVKGLIMVNMGEYKHGLKMIEESSVKGENIDNTIFLSLILYDLIRMKLIQDMIAEASVDLEKLKQIYDSNPGIHLIELRYLLSKALIYKKQKRLSSKVKGLKLLNEITSLEKWPDSMLCTLAAKHQIELLIDEYRLYGEESTLNEIKSLLDRIIINSMEQFVFPHIVEAQILQAKLALVEGEIKMAENFLRSAERFCEDNNLTRLKVEVEKEIKELENQVHMWFDLASNNSDLYDRIQRSKVLEYLNFLNFSTK